MTYLVKIASRAERDLADLFQQINAHAVESAFHWYTGLKQAILSLEQHPNRCPLTRKRGGIRHLLYGRKPNVYRVIFRVLRRQQFVEVLHIRHAARKKSVGRI